MDDNLLEIGDFKREFNQILDTNLPIGKIYQSKRYGCMFITR